MNRQLPTILLVDDERRMLDLLELFLIPQGFICIKADNGIQALEILQQEKVSLVLLDVMMPSMDGWETCTKIRQFSKVPVIMLTARTDKADIIKGLNNGADDYITKPFNEEELVARVNALLRRSPKDEEETDTIRTGEYELNTGSYTLHYQDKRTHLTLKEYHIVEAMITYPKRTFTREQLLQVAWDYNSETDIRTVDSHIRNLREKLKKAGFPTDQFLLTAWGIGYKWK